MITVAATLSNQQSRSLPFKDAAKRNSLWDEKHHVLVMMLTQLLALLNVPNAVL